MGRSQAGSDALRRRLGYRKFKGSSLSVLVLTSGYHLQGEVARVLESVGHTVHRVPVGGDFSDVLKGVLSSLVRFQPDFVLSINHLGFDHGGVLGETLERFEVPVAVWYVDSPALVLRDARCADKGWSRVFVWERQVQSQLRDRGYNDIHFLPLATDPTVFKPGGPGLPLALTFVGGSNQGHLRKWLGRIPLSDHRFIVRLGEEIARDRSILCSGRAPTWLPKESRPYLHDLMGAAMYLATIRYRSDLLGPLVDEGLFIYGDSGWSDQLPEATLPGGVPYGERLAYIYANSDISINATSAQMAAAVNQRVFDVPAAGGFLLSDDQDDLREVFDVGREAVTYTDRDELRSLVHYYRDHRERRLQIAAAGRARVLREHTYAHRVDTMITLLGERYG